MPQVELEQATIDYRVVGPEDSAHPPVLFVHGILVDRRLWVRVAEGVAQQGFVHTAGLAARLTPSGEQRRRPSPRGTPR
jgi:pimeloyl-ACP methyl ester carboxylesterase